MKMTSSLRYNIIQESEEESTILLWSLTSLQFSKR